MIIVLLVLPVRFSLFLSLSFSLFLSLDLISTFPPFSFFFFFFFDCVSFTNVGCRMDTDRQGHVRTNSSQNLPPPAVPWKLSPRLIIYDAHLFKFYDG